MDGAENDEGAIDQANKLINKLNELINNINNYFEEKNKFEEIKQLRDEVAELARENGTLEKQDEFDKVSRELDEAIENEDALKIDQLQNALFKLKAELTPVHDQIEQIKQALFYLIHLAEYEEKDADLVNDLKEQGKVALDNEDVPAMANIANKLINLMKNDGAKRGVDDVDDNGVDTS